MTQDWHVYQASEAQKKNQMGDHRQELFSPEFLRGFARFFEIFLFRPPLRFVEGKPEG